MHVYGLTAKFVCPLTGMEGRPDSTKKTSTFFATEAIAESRVENFKQQIRSALQVDPDYEIEVFITKHEVITA